MVIALINPKVAISSRRCFLRTILCVFNLFRVYIKLNCNLNAKQKNFLNIFFLVTLFYEFSHFSVGKFLHFHIKIFYVVHREKNLFPLKSFFLQFPVNPFSSTISRSNRKKIEKLDTIDDRLFKPRLFTCTFIEELKKFLFNFFLSALHLTHTQRLWVLKKTRRYPKFAFFSDSARYQRKKYFFLYRKRCFGIFFSFDVDSKPFLRILRYFFYWKTFHCSWRRVYALSHLLIALYTTGYAQFFFHLHILAPLFYNF